jgi:hypothetical protein
VTETFDPFAWDLTTTCDDGSDPSAVALSDRHLRLHQQEAD